MNIQEKIKDLGLVPLFPDYNYFESSKNENDKLKVTSDEYDFRQVMSFKRPLIKRALYVSMEILNENFDTEMHFVINDYEVTGDAFYRDDYFDLKFNNLPDVLNFFNEKYENVAKVFNELLLQQLKDELAEEKKKQDETRKQKQEGEEKEQEQDDMSSQDIDKLLEELQKEQENESTQGQSNSNDDDIDLEDFLDKVEQGEAENDFTKGYNNPELKEQINNEKLQQLSPEFEDMNFDLPDFPSQPSNSNKKIQGVKNAFLDMLNTNSEDIKRQFPTEKSVKSFVSLLSPQELDFISAKVGLPEGLSRIEKQKLITSNFITELLENI